MGADGAAGAFGRMQGVTPGASPLRPFPCHLPSPIFDVLISAFCFRNFCFSPSRLSQLRSPSCPFAQLPSRLIWVFTPLRVFVGWLLTFPLARLWRGW